MNDRKLIEAADKAWNKSNERTWEIGRLGIPNGSGYDIEVADRPGYVYVSRGDNGELGAVIAQDKVSVALVGNQRVRMRRENGRLIIREAEQYLGNGGATMPLSDLSDVLLTGLADGDKIEWDSGTGKWINVVGAGTGGAPSPHALDSAHHSGTLSWANVSKTGSNLTDIATRNHSDLQGVTANQHHDQVHALVGSDHTAAGLTVGHVVRATGATTFAWAQLQHTDLGGVTADQHHNQVHSITGSDHTITASQYQIVGATATNTLGLLTPSSSPGAAVAILRTDSNGGIALDTSLFVVDGSGNTVKIDTTLFVADAGTDIVTFDTSLVSIDASTDIVAFDTNLVVINGSANTVKINTTLLNVDPATSIVTIDTNVIYADGANNRVGINKTPSGAALDVVVTANADHTQRLKQKSGQTGRLWRIEDSSGTELIVLDSQGNLQSGNPGFTSGLTGWQITPAGTAEFNNVWVRGELHATVFVKDEIHATGGTMLVATAGKLYSDAVIDSTTSDTETLQFETASGLVDWEVDNGSTVDLEVVFVANYIEIEDPPSGPGFYFTVGDVVRSKTEVDTGVTDFWLEICHGIQYTGYSRYSVIKQSGTDGTLPAGSAVVSYGQEGDGRILLTSDLNYAPYMDVFTVGPDVWTGAAGAIVPHVRLGRLDGVGVTAVSGIEQYGLIAGTDLSDANSPYVVLSNLQLLLYRVDLTLNDGTNDTGEITAAGNVTLGTNISSLATTSLQVISGGANAGDVVIGQEAGNYLKWDQSAALLTVNGTLQVGGSSVATQTYADTAGDSRRLAAMTGTITGTGATTITWLSVSIRLADGTTKAVTDGFYSSLDVNLRFFYVDTSAAAPLTVQYTTSLASIDASAGHLVLATGVSGTEKAVVTPVIGMTTISGDAILTGTIVASRIKAGTITANEIAANTITAAKIVAGTITATEIAAGTITAAKIAAGTITATEIASNAITTAKINASAVTAAKISVDGNIDIATTGAIRGNAKAYGSSTAGFFLGYATSAYKFDIGDGDYYLRWDGSNINLSMNTPLQVKADGSDVVMRVVDSASNARSLYFSSLRLRTNAEEFEANNAFFDKVEISGDTFKIATTRTPASSGATGIKGEICWDSNYLYVCIATNSWRRIPMFSGGTYW